VAGTNGKGSTCAMLEALLILAGKNVGFYSSPHLVSTVERIRLNGIAISEEKFVEVFKNCENLIRSCELSHFEALTLMAGDFYFSKKLDYVILEVGLGGTFDATNAFPHHYSVITPIDFDHIHILGRTLPEIAQNKLGIIQFGNQVIYQKLQPEILQIAHKILEKTNSTWVEVKASHVEIRHENQYFLKTEWGETALALIGKRSADNAMTALTVFAVLGLQPEKYLHALKNVNWPGRMQKLEWPQLKCPLYLSGDHNPHGMKSFIEILKDFSWNDIYIVVGIGVDKEADSMLAELTQLKNIKLYLTETPFKGRTIEQYPEVYRKLAQAENKNPIELLNMISKSAQVGDLAVVTGSLYLVGDVLKQVQSTARKNLG
jgi:dihydrofolate synthase / folylpolyglutamate synthase